MYYFKELREKMVEEQLVLRGIKDKRVLSAMKIIPRELFLPEKLKPVAYDDGPLPIGYGQTISQPYIVALMTELLTIKEEDKILEIGTGSGYQSAILSLLAQKVFTIEKIERLSKKAKSILNKLGCINVEEIVGDGSVGFAKEAPFDKILVTAGTPFFPLDLKNQLSPNFGTAVIPIGDRHMQTLTKIVREGDTFKKEESIPCMFVPLVGKYGWQSENGK
ncbi:protein-L-isoaspartate O-methyltransferase [candidate division WOR-1 bacterium RIFOXYD2_FULL_36_8]|uniref:Protein-L-isoaspartate O-methyltransferase n=1 Tax=candidate division WOR-1 bacterium RIFOXYB2_FULL_36_35 TaxID=1802578 RepID=A0A1F4S609_UNCSA|nr:MAG: protein-L-isoaspartate O-methyltransferase [candidate division WOR-1 bacterium RIFOXYA2_FULL_36_21]OGC15871.1 MAG: protein-L-isoaspartate O-methyltransferase [candidate division WOR-1 bacterium RIFOXYB2_FULL_36_35]OGC16937.1 MAG: protein-L-isoaspartate O-methyltransferase [candidate division WOR-1 bacterium RIFOXYA12_FULL_36_13]OGC41574.1 MAG: protein-L-isoaspartate O-methyltransferase [candidate division WOR-1 bacterium RIFOXYD2_FULL_36_8]